MNESVVGKREVTKTEFILNRLMAVGEKRSCVIADITGCVGKLAPIETRPSAMDGSKQKEPVGVLETIERFIDAIERDNERLDEIRATLQKIV